ncbi:MULTISPECIES: hypothetical protein [unclassified Mycobacterium]|uniref:hypothetical protein n=1 Tax=unclassified Mycobacterium TaxID=2642494 RepID=UPI0029C88056|nr:MULTISPECIES: hypothetical protein [unclassified Mycobacterium]
MEPKRSGARHNRMLADTSAIHAFGAAQTRHAADLAAVTARLASAGGSLSPDALGPVGARFLAALGDAVAREARLVAGLGERVAAAGATAQTNADAYGATEHRAGQSLTGLGL